MDDSVALVSIFGALAAYVGLALSSPRGADLPRASLVALALGPVAACLAWMAAALLPNPHPWSLAENAGTVAASFAVLSALATLVVVGMTAFAWRGALTVRQAIRVGAFVSFALAILATVPASSIWRWDVPWVVVGMLVTIAISGCALVAAERMRPIQDAIA
jgi:hypothetical protein